MKKKSYQLIAFMFLFLNINICLSQNTGFVKELMENNSQTLDEIKQIADTYFQQIGTGQGTGYNQYQRWLYEQRFHRDQQGYKISFDQEYAAYQTAVTKMQIAQSTQKKTTPPWIELGPNTFSVTTSWNPGVGRCNSVAVNPTNNKIIYAASAGGGIWKTTNGGTTWAVKTDNYPNNYFQVEYITIDPSNVNTIYASLENSIVIKSVDAGDTWNPTGTGPTKPKHILVNPKNSSIVFVADVSGIWRSTDAGASWVIVSSDSEMEDIAYQPNSTSIMYASGSSNSTFLRSSDGGLTWTNITNGITNYGRTLIGVSVHNPQMVYLVQSNPNDQTFGRLYKSVNGGLGFTTVVVGDDSLGTNFFGYEIDGTSDRGQAYYDMGITVSPTNANEIHIAGIICWKSTNGGKTFTATTEWVYPNSTGYNHADVHQLIWVGNRIYSATDGGISYSDDKGNNWINIWEGMGTKMIYRLACSKTSDNTIAFGAQDNGQTYRLNAGLWNQWMGADGMDCAISPTNPKIGIGLFQYGGVQITKDGGISKIDLATTNIKGNWVTPVTWHPTDPNTFFVGWQGVYKTTNLGASWTDISPNISNRLDCITIAPSNENYIYASASDTLFVTKNGGTSWKTYKINPGLISSIGVSPLNPNKVWITTTASIGNVKVSSNAGLTFTSISAGLPNIAARCIAIDGNPEEGIYVGMNTGIYYRDNSTNAWEVYGTGLPQVSINDIEIQPTSKKLRIATYGRGVWETDLATVIPLCSNPSSLSTSNISSSGVKLSWSAEGGEENYIVEYKKANSSTWTVLPPLVTLSQLLVGLDANTDYEWRVKANCTGGSSDYVNGTFKTIDVICDAPIGLTVSDITSNSATLSWNALNGITNYTVEYKESSFFSWQPLTTTSSTSIICNNLTSGTSYDWRVRSNCSVGSNSIFASNTFTTNTFFCNVPSGLSASAITNNSALVSWNSVVGASSYSVSYKANNNTLWTSLPATTNTNISLTGLLPQTTYDWRVQANCIAGGTSGYISKSFSTIGSTCKAPTGLTSSSITSTSAILNWNTPQGGPISYMLEYKINSATIWTALPVVTTSSGSTNNLTISGLIANTLYDWRIRSICNTNTSLFSASTFSTTPKTCVSPTDLKIDNISTSSIKISWNSIPGITDYIVEYKTSSSKTWKVSPKTSINSGYTILWLKNNTTYNIRVKTVCENGESKYANISAKTGSQVQSCSSPSSLIATSESSNSIKFTWPIVSSATSYSIEFKPANATTWIKNVVTSNNYTIKNVLEGKYNCRINATCAIGTSNYINGNDFQSYCTASSVANDEFIGLVKIGNINRISLSDGGYVNVKNQSTTLVGGENYDIELQAGFKSSSYPEVFAVYIDYNRDGDFIDNGEQVTTQSITNSSIFNKSFMVPANITPGKTIMRVQMTYDQLPSSPCGDVNYGETEDYEIILESGLTPIAPPENNNSENEILGVETSNSQIQPLEARVRAFPNPTNEVINFNVNNITYEMDALLQIVTINGNIVYSQNIHLLKNSRNENAINISDLPSGTYRLFIINDETKLITAFIKK